MNLEILRIYNKRWDEKFKNGDQKLKIGDKQFKYGDISYFPFYKILSSKNEFFITNFEFFVCPFINDPKYY